MTPPTPVYLTPAAARMVYAALSRRLMEAPGSTAELRGIHRQHAEEFLAKLEENFGPIEARLIERGEWPYDHP